MNGNQKDSGVNMSGVRKMTECRMCGSIQLTPFFDLGVQPLANSLLKKEELEKEEPRYPLGLLFCTDCNLVQLTHVVDPKLLFPDTYVYHSSGIPSSPHFTQYAEEVRARFLSKPENFVVEIGSNDGHLLGLMKKTDTRVLGVDPAAEVAAIANRKGVPTRAEFFGESVGKDIATKNGQAGVVIANNVVAHIDNHHDLMRGVTAVLAPHGVFVFEAPYLGDMFDTLAFDSIYHEHMSYLSVRPLVKLCEKYGLELFDVQHFPVQGNSLRYYAAPKGTREILPRVEQYVQKEIARGFNSIATYENLVMKIKALREDVRNTVSDLKSKGKTIAAYGSPARGNTLLNYFGIDHTVIDYATEALSSKIGKYTPGTHIPIVDIVEARKNRPDYYLLLAWPYKGIVLEKEKEFVEKGGKFIIPVGDTRFVP